MSHHGHRKEVRRFIGSFRGHQSEHFHRFRIKSSGRIHSISIRSVAATAGSDPDALAASFKQPEHGLRGVWHRLDAVAATTSERPRHRPKNHPLHQKMETSRVDGVKGNAASTRSSSSRCGASFWTFLRAGCLYVFSSRCRAGCGPWRTVLLLHQWSLYHQRP